MTSLSSNQARLAPSELVAALRTGRSAGEDALAAVLRAWNLRQLGGGRNNDVFAWGNSVCIKLYKKADRQRVHREWHGLIHAVRLGCAPEPLWLDDDPHQPALGMTLLSGSPILDVLDPAKAVRSIAEVTRAMQNTPLTGPLRDLERVDSIRHYLTRLTHTWPRQLQNTTDDLRAVMLTLLRRWKRSADAELLAKPASRVYSRGDANLLNWLQNGEHTYVVDFEFSGYSDVAVDAADHIEHVSARAIPDHIWSSATGDLGITRANRARFEAAQRTIALRWLAVLWNQRTKRAQEFVAQHERVRALLD